MGACVSCALGEAPHKPGYGYGADVIKQQKADASISERLNLYDTPNLVTATQGTGTAGALDALQGSTNPSSPPRAAVQNPGPAPPPPLDPRTQQFPNGGNMGNGMNGGQMNSQMSPPQGNRSPPFQQTPPVYAPQAQRVPQVATFEMNSQSQGMPSPPPLAFDPYNQPPLEHPNAGFMGTNKNRASAALSIISSYDEGIPAGARSGMNGGRGGMNGGRGRGGMGGQGQRGGGQGAYQGGPQQGGQRMDNRGPPQRGNFGSPNPQFANPDRPSSRNGNGRPPGPGYGPPNPQFADQQRPSSRNGGQRPPPGPHFGPPQPGFAGDPRARSSSVSSMRTGGRPPGPGYGPPQPGFADQQRPSSRNGGGRPNFQPPFAGEERPSSRNGGGRGPGGYGGMPSPQFGMEQRPSSRNGGGRPQQGRGGMSQGMRGGPQQGGQRRSPPQQQQGFANGHQPQLSASQQRANLMAM